MFLNHLLSASNHLNSSLRTCPPSSPSECYVSAQFVCSPPSRLDLSRRHSSAVLGKSFNDPDDFDSGWLRMQRVEGGVGGSQHHHHHLRPLAFRCKTTEMLNLVTLEDDNIAKKKKTNSVKSNKQKNPPITAKLQANLSCDLASSENLTTSSEDGCGEDASDNDDDDDDDDDKTHYEQVLISIGESLFHNFQSDWSLTDVTDEEDNGTDSKHGQNDKAEDCYEEYLEEDLGHRNRRDRLVQKLQILNLQSIRFAFNLAIDRIHICWHELVADKIGSANMSQKSRHKYRLCLYLLNKDMADYRDDPGTHLLTTPIQSKSVQTRLVGSPRDERKPITLTDVCFEPESVNFSTGLQLFHDQVCFHTKVVRLELERYRSKSSSHSGQQTIPVGFVDIDLASCVRPGRQNKRLPFVLFGEFNDKINRRTKRRQRKGDNRGNLYLQLFAQIEAQALLEDANMARDVGLLVRPEMSPDCDQEGHELKFHVRNPAAPLHRHLLNVLGLSAPGSLYRISLHFGQLEHLVLPSSVSSIYACFEVKNLSRLSSAANHVMLPFIRSGKARSSPAIDKINVHHDHHHGLNIHRLETRNICCRTRRLENCCFNENECANFDQSFTFYERFMPQDSPSTSLTIRSGNRDRKLYKYRAPLSEFIDCRSVKQFFHLSGPKRLLRTGVNDHQHCRLQFSISVELIAEN